MKYLERAASQNLLGIPKHLVGPDLDGQKPVWYFKGDNHFLRHKIRVVQL